RGISKVVIIKPLERIRVTYSRFKTSMILDKFIILCQLFFINIVLSHCADKDIRQRRLYALKSVDFSMVHSRFLKCAAYPVPPVPALDRKSTRLNSSHVSISYAVFCLNKYI